jgi:hypothetical protein
MSLFVFRRLCIYLIAVSVAFFALDRVCGIALQQLVKESGFRFSKLYRGGFDADIVVLGNSRAVNAFFVPEMEKRLGQSVFHLGYNGMSTEVCEALFLDYLEHNTQPETLLLEVTNLHVSNGVLKDLKLFSGMSSRLQSLIERDEPSLSGACRITHLYQFNCELFQRVLFYLGKSDRAWINSGQIDSVFAANYIPTQEEQDECLYLTDGLNWKALQRIETVCYERGIELRLIASPYLPEFRQNLIHYDEWVSHFRAELQQPNDFYDFTNTLDSSDYYADVLHINRRGSDALLELMMASGVFSSTE